MGYHTRHNLQVLSGNTDLIEKLREECENAKFAVDSNGDCYDECKWYDHEKDLRAFSKKHPDEVFLLEGEGEEQPDLWKEYYKDGKMQHCKAIITYPSFNESLLS